MTDTVSILAEAFEDHQRGAAAPGTSLFEFMAKRLAAASPQGEGSSADPAPIKPSGDTGDLRKRVAQIIEAAIERHNPGNSLRHTIDDADAILDLIQSEKVGSPIGQNDQPGLAFSAPERGK